MWLAAKFAFPQDTGPSFCWGLTALFCFLWCCASILSIGYSYLGGLVSFLAREVISQVRQISVAFFKSKFDSWSNNSGSLLETLKAILSLITRSFSLKLPKAAQEYNSVRDTSKGSWNGMFQNQKLWRTSFSCWLQYSSSFSRTFAGSFLSSSALKWKWS